jgi:O-antigen/teichoic acid export membrane protein
MAVKIVITFIMTPIIVHNLGKYDYGLWEMLGAALGYMGMLDIGLKPTTSRFAAKHLAEKDRASLMRVYSSGIFFACSIGVFLCCVFFLWAWLFPEILAQEGAPASRYAALLVIVGIQLVFRFPGFVAESFLEGFQKYYLKNNITILNSIAGASILYAFITPENGLVLLAFVNTVGLSVKYVVFGILLTRENQQSLKPDFRDFDRKTLRVLLGFGSKSLIQGASSRIETSTDSLVIGLFLSPAVVPFYTIPANLVRYVQTLGHTLTHAFMPVFSGMNASAEHEMMRHVYIVGSKYVVGIIVPIAAGIILVGGPFIGVWIGPEFREKGDLIIFLLVVFIVVPMLNPFASRYLTAIDRHGVFARLSPLSALLNLGLSLALVKPMGIVGVALASTIPVFIFIPYYLHYVCRYLEMSVQHYARESIAPCLLPTVLMSLAVAALRFKWGLDSYAMILAAVLSGAVIYTVLFWLLSLRNEERIFIMRRIPGMARG